MIVVKNRMKEKNLVLILKILYYKYDIIGGKNYNMRKTKLIKDNYNIEIKGKLY